MVAARGHADMACRPHELLHEFLLAAVATAPRRAAVVEFVRDGAVRTHSYQQLRAQSQAYAAVLADCGLGIGHRVLLDSDTSASAIAAFLACSQLGAAFVPVSPETPDHRFRLIAETVEPDLYLRADTSQREGLPTATGRGCFGPGGLEIERRMARRVQHRRETVATDTAYIIFTSGTIGRPKGVVMSHRAVVSFYRGMLCHRIVGVTDRVATTSPLQFDFSLLDIGLALGSGAAVVPVPRALLRWPRRFLQVLSDTQATQVNGVPSIWRQVLRHEQRRLAELDRIRGVLFCGEEFQLAELRVLQRLLPGARIVNCYGSTESMACSFADVQRPLPGDAVRLSIGHGHPGAELMLVNGEGIPVEEPDVMGEIYLRSPALFTGYWNDPDATGAALVPDPVEPRSGQVVLRTGDLAYRDRSGEFYFCRRADTQVQIRGNRVELGEVEHRLREFPGILAAAVTVLQLPGGEPELAAFVLPASEASGCDETALVSFCAEALPDYMVPRLLRVVDELPSTANGKVDHPALTAQAIQYLAPWGPGAVSGEQIPRPPLSGPTVKPG